MRAKQITNCILMLVFALLSEVSVVIADEVPQGQILTHLRYTIVIGIVLRILMIIKGKQMTYQVSMKFN